MEADWFSNIAIWNIFTYAWRDENTKLYTYYHTSYPDWNEWKRYDYAILRQLHNVQLMKMTLSFRYTCTSINVNSALNASKAVHETCLISKIV